MTTMTTKTKQNKNKNKIDERNKKYKSLRWVDYWVWVTDTSLDLHCKVKTALIFIHLYGSSLLIGEKHEAGKDSHK
jgi:hypothetical protein